MPILDIQQRFRELGRIRTGQQVATGKVIESGKRKGEPITRPTKLDRFRLTSPRPDLIDQAASVFGGKPAPWHNDGTGGDEYEVVVEVESLPVVVPPGDFFEQWYELWTGGGCERRCDGERQVIVDRACACPADVIERQELASKGKACKPTTRVRLFLPDVADVGIWRLESHGFHAAAELGGAAGLVEAATRLGAMIPADLRLQAREGARRPGEQRRKFYVPAITFRGVLGPTLEALGVLDASATTPVFLGDGRRPALTAGGSPELPSGATPFAPPAVEPASLPGSPPTPTGEAAPLAPDPGPGDVAPTEGFTPPGPRANDQGRVAADPAPFDPPAHVPDPEVPAEEGGSSLTAPQMIAIRAKARGYEPRDERLALVSAIVGRKVESSKDLGPREVRTVLEVLDDQARTDAFAQDAVTYYTAADPVDDEDGSAEDAPIETNAVEAPASRAVTHPKPAVDGPETWDGERWRTELSARGVKVVALLREAARLARARDVKAPGTLDDVAGSGLADELLGFAEATMGATS